MVGAESRVFSTFFRTAAGPLSPSTVSSGYMVHVCPGKNWLNKRKDHISDIFYLVTINKWGQQNLTIRPKRPYIRRPYNRNWLYCKGDSIYDVRKIWALTSKMKALEKYCSLIPRPRPNPRQPWNEFMQPRNGTFVERCTDIVPIVCGSLHCFLKIVDPFCSCAPCVGISAHINLKKTLSIQNWRHALWVSMLNHPPTAS